MKNSFSSNPRVRIDDLAFTYIDDPKLEAFLHHEIEKWWNVVDWNVAKEEIINRVRGILLSTENAAIAWCGWSVQAREMFNEIIELFASEDVEWYLLSNETEAEADVSAEKTPIKRTSLDTWKAENFLLTINVERHCPEIFHSRQASYDAAFLSPFTDEKCAARMWESSLGAMEEFLKKLSNDLETNKVIIFIALRHGNFPSIEHIAKGLRSVPNIKVYGVYLESDIPDGVYDNSFTCHCSLALLAEILDCLPPLVVYLQAHASWAYLSQFIKIINNQLKVVQEVYDWMGAFITDEKLFVQEGAFSTQQIGVIRKAEDYICNHLHGYLYKDNGAWMKKRVKESHTPALKIYPCPSSGYLHKPTAPQSDSPIKLVYAGQISHRHQSQRIFGDMYYMPVIKDLTNQGFHLTIYNALHHSRKYPAELYKEYYSEAKISPLFEFKKGIPMPEIIDELNGKYHYGLIAYYFEDDLGVGMNHLKGTMASKLFTYLSAGLPVIVSEQFEYMAEIVSGEGIGLVVSRNDLQGLTNLLSHVKYKEVLENVRYAQKKYSMDMQIPKLKKMLGV